MFRSNVAIFALFLVVSAYCSVQNEQSLNLIHAKIILKSLNENLAKFSSQSAFADWNYSTNITDANLEILLKTGEIEAKNIRGSWELVKTVNWTNIEDQNIRRQFYMFANIDEEALSPEDFIKFTKLIADMTGVFAKAKICSFKNKTECYLQLEPDLYSILAKSRDAEELKYYWVEWRKVAALQKERFIEYVELLKKAAGLNGFKDPSEMWLRPYECNIIKDTVAKLWDKVKPLYLQLHAYVRFKLKKVYGDVVSERGPIPAHLLGNMWAQSWEKISDLVMPFPEGKQVNITDALVKNNFTAKKIFQTAEDFFVSLNLSRMTEDFWNLSLIEKLEDRDMVCHASASDFYKNKTFAIKMCTSIEESSFYVVHHEMGHVEYYMQYENQPPVFHQGANPAFHEAIGDTIELSVRTMKHLSKIGLSKEENPHREDVLNNLFKIALAKLTFLPFGYLVDLWRWDVFSGKIQPENYNSQWWKLREEYQGVTAPVERSEKDFDPGSKYHVIANVKYIRYFLSFILQFQFHRALCIKAGQYSPDDPNKQLHNCDIYNCTQAGNALKEMLKLGNSKPWSVALEMLTGQKYIDAEAVVEYFQPIYNWLKEENEKYGVWVGW